MRFRTFMFPRGVALAMLLLAPTLARAQGFHAVHSQDGIDVWAVGDNGGIYRSFDRGLTWTSQTLGNKALRGVVARGFNVIVVGDSGKIWRSQNSGGTWALQVMPGTPQLNAIEMASPQVAFVVGAGGVIFKTENAGGSWSALASGTTATLRAARFVDEYTGWVAGDNGTVRSTVTSGLSWDPIAIGTTKAFFGLDVKGARIWVAGADGAAWKSVDGGVTFHPVGLRLDGRADVKSVWIQSPSTVFLAGGGGFIRKSVDDGVTWSFPIHPMQAQISSLYFFGSNAWAANNKNRVVLSSFDSGTTWALPSGAGAPFRRWQEAQPTGGSIRGSSFGIDGTNKNALYCAMGAVVYRSLSEGDSTTWAPVGIPIPNCSKVNAFIVSPKDTNVMLAAVSGVVARRVVKSDDHGLSWMTVLTHEFGEYGIPLEYDPDHPDTIYFGGDTDVMYRSTDGGKNWGPWSTNAFRSPCDIISVPDSSNIILVGDGITGSGQGEFWKSTDYGHTFVKKATRPIGASEIPGMACGRLRNSAAFGTNWGSGGVQRSTDFGETWPGVSVVGSAWGIDVGKDDPNCMIFGVYGGGLTYLSLDGGVNFLTTPLTGSNYSFYIRDRATIMALQSGGLYKLQTTYPYTPVSTQALSVVAPNGGEDWAAGTTHAITWTSQNVAVARVEYQRTSVDPWQLIVELPGYQNSYPWTVPVDATTGARIRVRDAWDAAPTDSSNGTFTITVAPQFIAGPAPLELLLTLVGTPTGDVLRIENSGTSLLQVTNVTSTNGRFWTGRTSFTVPVGEIDTTGVWFSPGAAGRDSAMLTFTTNDPQGVHLVKVTGQATANVAVDHGATSFAVWQNNPNPFTTTTEIRYALPSAASVNLEVFNLQGQRVARLVSGVEGPGVHSVRFGPGVRIAGGERIPGLPSGVYFYRLDAGRFSATHKMLLMR